jgi:uncharacterized membrane protein
MIPELKILLISMLPVGELRVGIPVGVAVYHLSIWSSFLWSLIGNLIPIVFIILLLDAFVSRFLMKKFRIFNKIFTWLFERTRKRYSKNIERWKDLALMIFVAIPLPGTGAWTGALIAYAFGIPIRRAFPMIALGVLIAGIIVSLVTLGIINLPFL